MQPEQQPWSANGDLEITPELLVAFSTSLKRRNITIDGISGGWGPDLVALANLADPHPSAPRSQFPSQAEQPPPLTLILASETIYSLPSLRAFTHTVLSFLGTASSGCCGEGLAFVAAKKVYFGVGGGVEEFLSTVRDMGGWSNIVWEEGGTGVGRCVLEVGIE